MWQTTKVRIKRKYQRCCKWERERPSERTEMRNVRIFDLRMTLKINDASGKWPVFWRQSQILLPYLTHTTQKLTIFCCLRNPFVIAMKAFYLRIRRNKKNINNYINRKCTIFKQKEDSKRDDYFNYRGSHFDLNISI